MRTTQTDPHFPNNQDRNREALLIHIAGLETTLARRNARIAELEAKLTDPKVMDKELDRKLKAAYNRGWKECAAKLMEATRKAAVELSKVRKDALNVYLEGDK